MRKLNDDATLIFLELVKGIEVGDARKVDNVPSFRPVHVDRTDDSLFAIAQYTYLNGDACSDPDVELLLVSEADGSFSVFPLAYQDLRTYVRFGELGDDGNVEIEEEGQENLAAYCERWLANIARHQGIAIPRPPAVRPVPGQPTTPPPTTPPPAPHRSRKLRRRR
jgi:hypothetical protein